MEYDSRDDIPFLLSTIRPEIDMVHIGAGSNLLFTADYPGVVVHSAVRGIDIVAEEGDSVLVKAGSGLAMDELVEWACSRGLWGLENLSGIPGEVGSAAVQNVGAYGVEAADIIETIDAYDSPSREFVTLAATDCSYGYRDSMFKRPGLKGRYIIAAVTFRLWLTPRPRISYPALASSFPEPPASPAQVRRAVIAVRDSKLPDPSQVPSAGSFFKNPVVSRELFASICQTEGGEDTVPHYTLADGIKIPAAWLIDRCGWKGRTMGNAAVWHLQPLVIVNPHRKATPAEIIALEQAIVSSVSQRFGITLSPEVEHI